jgi:acyl carrier protein phosphodiesterase
LNYLAHLYLSGDNPEVMIGNFIADHVIGKHYDGYSKDIIKGVELHRDIDAFTDSHPIVEIGKQRLRPEYHKYTPVIVDIFYDHFLAANWKDYSKIPLREYSDYCYKIVMNDVAILPEGIRKMMPYMIEYDWLYNYSNLDGIEKVMKGMSRRAKFKSNMELSINDLKKDYDLYAAEFKEFFPEIMAFTKAKLDEGSQQIN